MEKKEQLNRLFIIGSILLLLTIIGSSFYFLDVDYSPLRRWGDCGDEGFWVHNARMKVLFGRYRIDEFNQPIYGAPVFNYFTYLSFRCFGISLYSARLVSFLAFLLTLPVLFFILRRHFSARTLLVYGLFILVSHEIMMYYTWATPIFLEVLFYLLILFVYEKAKKTNEYIRGALIAIFFLAAVFSKLSSLYFTIPLVFFGFREIIVLKNCTYRFALAFLSVGGVIVCSYYFFYYRVHEQAIQQFLSGIAYSNIKTFPDILRAILIVPFNLSIFKYPSVIVVFIFSVFRSIDILRSNGYNIRKSIVTMNTIEFYCFCWIIGSLVSLSFTGEVGFDRRMIHMYFPFSILSLYFVSGILQRPGTKTSVGFTKRDVRLKWILFISMSVYFFFYFFAIPKNRLFFVVLGINKSVLYYLFYAILSIAISYWYCFKQHKKQLVYGLLGYFFISSCVLNFIWLFNPTYTVRNMNAAIERLPVGTNKYLYGVNAHLYTINESKLIPMWYRNPPMGKTQINEWFNEYSESEAYLYVSIDSMAGNNNDFLRNADVPYIKPVRAERMQVVLEKMKIAPFPYINVSRLSADLVQVESKRGIKE